ncbi:MAG: purine-nucleoside phosphorylase [Idiomarina sp.]|nr:purine-nucleoside phosphorylase [Idiomarina sp.]
MPTPHIEAAPGDIAELVLMPGDPIRAEFIASNWLHSAKLISRVRNMLAFTGIFQGVPVTVMASGMGMPSMGIYCHELFTEYQVGRILRVGSCGSYESSLNPMDLVLATEAWTDSSFAEVYSGVPQQRVRPSTRLNERLYHTSFTMGIELKQCAIHSSDVFYRKDPEYYQRIREREQLQAVEMEAFALFYLAEQLGREAASLLTVSDSLVNHSAIDSHAREQAFLPMIELALKATTS